MPANIALFPKIANNPTFRSFSFEGSGVKLFHNADLFINTTFLSRYPGSFSTVKRLLP
jgi:hypothetical protein